MKRRILIVVLFLILTVSCSNGKTTRTEINIPQTINDIPDICQEPINFGFEFETAASSPAFVDVSLEDGISFNEMGMRGAQELANSLSGGISFCDFNISTAAEEVLNRAIQSAHEGDYQAAQLILRGLLNSPNSSINIILVSHVSQPNKRQTIRDLLQAAEMDMFLGGDGQDFVDGAKQAFREIAQSELQSANLIDTLGIAEDSMRLGVEDIEKQALERLDEIGSEMIDAAIADFDPCTADKNDIKDLLSSLASAMLLGINGTYSEDGERYTQVVDKARMAAQRLFNEVAKIANLPELIVPVPACEISGEIEVMMLKPWADSVYISVGRISFQVLSSKYPAEVQGNGKIFFQESVPHDVCSLITNIDAEVDISGTFTMIGKAGEFDLEMKFGAAPDYGRIDCPHGQSGGSLKLPSLTYPVHFYMVDNSTEDVSGIYHLVLHLNN